MRHARGKHLMLKYIRRMNEMPSSWLLLATVLGVLGYITYLVGNGMTW
jgi:hypothetical protein